MSIRYFGQLIQGEEPTPPKPGRLYDVGTRILFVNAAPDTSVNLTVRTA